MPDLITRQEYKDYEDISSPNQDDEIDFLIPKVSAFIKTYCRRTFNDFISTDKVDVFNGGYYYLIPSDTPIISITSLEFSADLGQNYTTLTEFTDWVLIDDSLIGKPTGTCFSSAKNGYRLSYKSGYVTLPEDLKLAVLDMVKYYLRNDGTVHGTKFSNTNTMQIEHISDAALPAYIKRVLDPYIADVA